MPSSSVEVFTVERQAQPVPSSETMALDSESTEQRDTLDVVDLQSHEPSDRPNLASITSPPTHPVTEAQISNHETFTANGASAPVTEVSSGIAPTAPFLPTEPSSTMHEDSIAQPPESASTPAPQEFSTASAPSHQSVPQPSEPESGGAYLIATAVEENTREAVAPAASTTDLQSLPPSPPRSQPSPPQIPSQITAVRILPEESSTDAIPGSSPTQMDQEMQDAAQGWGKVARSREEDEAEESQPRSPKRTKIERDNDGTAEFKVPELPAAASNSTAQNGTASTVTRPSDAGPMTKAQQVFLANQIRNLKKIKHAAPFNKPVDIVALNIPTYPQVVPHPMDLSTMEQKLKAGEYASVDDYIADFELIVQNCFAFNGMQHPVSASAQNLKASFDKSLQHLPKPTIKDPSPPAEKSKKTKKASVSAPKEKRQSRPSIASASSPPAIPASPSEAFALNADGLPTIRRDSSVQNGRPKREIKHAAPRDLPYSNAKPRRKKYALELRFCQEIVDELNKQKYFPMTWPFDKPVDPVALNIPTYHKLIKKPMDFGTITMKLKSGQYENAKDFESDVRLMFTNCYKFNPPTDNIHILGKQFEAKFDELWASKGEWMAEHAPHSGPQSPSFAQDSDDEQDEEAETIEDVHDRMLQIQQQISKLSAEAVQLQTTAVQKVSPKVTGKKPPKAAKTSTASKGSKKSGSAALSGGSKKQSKPRPKRYVTYEEKQEIAEQIDSFNGQQLEAAISILRKLQPGLPGINGEDLEIDIDELDNDTLYQLLMFVRQVSGRPRAAVEDEYQPPRPAARTASTAQKPKKNKPMSKIEQETNIEAIRNQLGRFANAGSGDDNSPEPVFKNNAESSGDEEESGSESEEE